jgi:hypothetical protein
MSYQDFLTTLTTGLSSRIDPELRFEIRSFPRNNDTHYEGLVIMRPGRNVSPTIYLPPYYHRYLEGVPLSDIYDDILNTYKKHLPENDFDTSLFTDFEKAAPHIVMRLVSCDRNKELLKKVPHFSFQDLAVIFYCLVYSDGASQANIMIHRDHLGLWDIDENELYDIAKKNTRRLLPPELIPLSRLIEDSALPDCEDLVNFDVPMYILSNTYRSHGATTILYDGLLSEIAERLDSDLLLIPSSVHEMLIVPVTELAELDFPYFNTMVSEVNETQLSDADILIDHTYFFSREDNMLSIP